MNRHIPVLLAETVEQLNLVPNATVIDCTLGDAGHAEAILEKTAPHGQLFGIDADIESILRAKLFLYRFEGRVTFVRDNFSQLKKIADEYEIDLVDGIVMDLGWSTPQFAERGRGFSFLQDEPLDMRFGGEVRVGRIKTAAEYLAELSAVEIAAVLHRYGEEKLAKEIAEAIVKVREKEPLATTKQLAEVVLSVYRTKLKTDKEIPWIGGIHPATQTFQALRILVNDELEVLRSVLPQAVDLLKPGGRLAVITFHSLEDRIVKHFFQKTKTIKIITKKPIIATAEELTINPRARSAKLRVVEKI